MSNMEQIEVIVAEAMKCGMSYGEFVAKNPLYVARLSIKTVIQLAKTSFARLSGSGATDEKSIKIREYKLPALMQLLISNGRKPV